MIHKFSMNGVNVVIDVFSGAVHVADDTMYDIVDAYENCSRDEILNKFKGKYWPKVIFGDGWERKNFNRKWLFLKTVK